MGEIKIRAFYRGNAPENTKLHMLIRGQEYFFRLVPAETDTHVDVYGSGTNHMGRVNVVQFLNCFTSIRNITK